MVDREPDGKELPASRVRPLELGLVAVAILAALTLWWWPYLVKGWLPQSEWAYCLIWGDWLADRRFLIGQGVIPEWNPNNVLGVNYIGRDPFNNPLSIANFSKFLFTDPRSEWIAALCFWLIVLGYGTFLFLRLQGVSRPVALLGAVLVTIYPKWMDDIHHGPGKFVTAYSTIPWIMVIACRMFQARPRLVHFVALGCLGALAFCGSGAWVSVLAAYILIPYYILCAWKYFSRHRAPVLEPACWVALGSLLSVVIALGLSAYLMFPLWDNLRLSVRSLYSPPAGYGLVDLLGLVFPWCTRLYSAGCYDLPLPLPLGIGVVSNLRSYMGILTVPFLVLVVCDVELRSRFAYFWIWPLTMALLASKPANVIFPVLRIFEQALGAQTSENFLFVGFIFCSTVIVCGALDALICWPPREVDGGRPFLCTPMACRVTSALMYFYLVAIGLWVFGCVLSHMGASILTALLTFGRAAGHGHAILRLSVGLQLAAYSYFHDRFFFIVLIAFLARLGALRWLRAAMCMRPDAASEGTGRRQPSLVGLATFLVLDFATFPHLIYPFTGSLDIKYSPDVAQNAFIRDSMEPLARVACHHPYQKTGAKTARILSLVKERFPNGLGWDPVRLHRAVSAINEADLGFLEPLFDPSATDYAVSVGRATYNYHESLLPDYFFDFDAAMNGPAPGYYRNSWNAVWNPGSPLIDVAAIRYLFWYAPLSDPRFELVKRCPVGDLYLYRNRRAVPRVYLASRVELIPARRRLLDRLQESSFDLATTVATEDESLPAELGSGGVAPLDCAGTVEVVTFEANRLVFKTAAASRSILVVTDLYFPYWSAEVDGRPTPIHRVNAVFRGVVLPAGAHTVEMLYRNPAFHRGVTVSAVSLLGVIGLLLSIPLRRLLTHARRARY